MKKLKTIIAVFMFSMMIGILPASAQDNTTSSTTTTNVKTESSNTPDAGLPIGMIAGGIGIVALALIVVYMVRNRRNSIGGIQSQDKSDPRPVTTQSINNPGSGV